MITQNNELKISSECEIMLEDFLVLGKRTWKYVGRSEDFAEYAHEQNEFVFDQTTSSPGATGTRRVFSQSELRAFIDAGFLYRHQPVQIKIGNAVVARETPTHRLY